MPAVAEPVACGQASMTLSAHLTTLESSGLILLAQLQPEVEYLFRHALIQEAAYNSLVKLDRRMVHQAVGQALERLYAADLASPELTPVLARHFAEAGDQRRALRYYTLAGRAASQVYANAEAIQHFERALEIAQHLSDANQSITDLYLRRGRALELNAQDAEAIANYEAMEAWAATGADRSAQLAALIARATVYVKPSVVANATLGFDLSQKALALARELGDRPAEAKVLWNLLQYYLAVGRNDQAVAHGERALAIAREQGLREQIAYVLTDMNKAYFLTDQADRARAALEEALSIWRELGILNMLADNLASMAMVHIMSGRYEQALAHSDEAQLVSQRIGNLWNQSYALYLVDLLYFDRGDSGRALEVAEECMRLAAQAGFAEGLNQGNFDLVLIYGYMGAMPRAIEIARRMQARAESLAGAAQAFAQVEALLPLLYALNGRLAEAQVALDECRLSHDPDELQRQFIMTQCLFAQAQAEVALANKDPQHALALAVDISLALRRSGVRLFLADALCLQGRALRAAGRLEEAQSVLEAARAEAEDLGSRRSHWQVLAELAALAAARGDRPAALALRRQALEIVKYVAERAGSADLRESFLSRPAVRELFAQVPQA